MCCVLLYIVTVSRAVLVHSTVHLRYEPTERNLCDALGRDIKFPSYRELHSLLWPPTPTPVIVMEIRRSFLWQQLHPTNARVKKSVPPPHRPPITLLTFSLPGLIVFFFFCLLLSSLSICLSHLRSLVNRHPASCRRDFLSIHNSNKLERLHPLDRVESSILALCSSLRFIVKCGKRKIVIKKYSCLI
jgi:hypothetical protein